MHANADLRFECDGAECIPTALDAEKFAQLWALFADIPVRRAGERLHGVTGLGSWLAPDGPIGAVASRALGRSHFPVRALLFDKTQRINWSVRWHQDRTIVVARRVEVEGFGPWSVKAGFHHVEPPFDLLASMATLRVHLDPVPDGNAPLLIAPGSHRLGRIRTSDVVAAVERCGVRACVAEAGDIWLYATPILHASKPSRSDAAPQRRRVLQLDFATRELPGGLEWMGI